MEGITEYFVQLGIQKQKDGAKKESSKINVYTKMS